MGHVKQLRSGITDPECELGGSTSWGTLLLVRFIARMLEKRKERVAEDIVAT